MFRSSAPNPLDQVIAQATDERLTSENWELILNVCDQVNSDPENGAKNAVNGLIKRLQNKNANVLIYTLTLTNSLAQNCGTKMQSEIASRKYTNALIKLGTDRSVHHSVKEKILETMSQLTRQFKNDASLGIMADAYNTFKSKNPRIQAPVKPQKHRMTDADRQREEEELQMALALSLSDAKEPSSSFQRPQQQEQKQEFANESSTSLPGQEQSVSETIESEKKGAGKTPATISRVRALYDLNATEPGELSFRKGDIITVVESVYRDWWRGSLHGQVGIFPLNYVSPVAEPTAKELQKDFNDEVKVMNESKNIEKLLTILSTNDVHENINVAENEELQNLYHSTLAIRPKLVKLIDKYSQKKDDLVELNEKYTVARRKYDALMEGALSQYSHAHPPQQQQQQQPFYSMPEPITNIPQQQQQQPAGTSSNWAPNYPPVNSNFYQQQQQQQQQPPPSAPPTGNTNFYSPSRSNSIQPGISSPPPPPSVPANNSFYGVQLQQQQQQQPPSVSGTPQHSFYRPQSTEHQQPTPTQ